MGSKMKMPARFWGFVGGVIDEGDFCPYGAGTVSYHVFSKNAIWLLLM